jgi:glutaryl-CoA dehydrogenase
MELARVDASVATFLGRAHRPFGRIDLSVRGRAAEATLAAAYDAFRQDRLVRLDGATGGVGDIRGNMTTCRREGDSWILNGQKKWIGNATFADINVIWAREEESNQVKGFVVGKENRASRSKRSKPRWRSASYRTD